ncbi:MAG: histidinol dehydrogenase [Alphaproteobacteria bacterium]|nr:histidinol dehydrogenase [Alphaproteobacteria bacterium]
MVRRLDASAKDFDAGFAALLAKKRDTAEAVDRVAAEIVADVRARGDAALIEHTRRLDRIEPTEATLRLSDGEIEAAAKQAPEAAVEALKLAARRIEAYHRRQIPEDEDFVDADGVRLGWRWTALDSVGLYVPGGLAAYPSSLLMNAIPARVAGVGRLAVAMPTPEGRLNPLVCAAARLLGIDEIWRVGGAQAVAALAYGTASIAPVDKIVGPGNAYVAAAKRLVFGQVGIDLIAGPSEIVVLADRAADPRWVAADLMSQAEHDESSQAVLIADDRELADAVDEAVARLLETLPRRAIAAKSWADHGAILRVGNLEAGCKLVDRLAPEHVELMVARPDTLLPRIRHAGAIFLGRHAPEALGDYVAGSNHVLPTSRAARFASGLSVLDFVKRSSIMGCDAEAMRRIGPAAAALAEAEGLAAHALSVTLRLNSTKR